MPDKDQPLHASTSEAVTNNVRVEVESQYAPEHSQPFQSQWFFYYTIRITNESEETVQLLSRHWIITDASGHIEEVRGPGVVGEQPVLASGRVVSVHLGVSAQDLDRRDARHVSDGHDRKRRPFRRRDCPLRAPRAIHGPLGTSVRRTLVAFGDPGNRIALSKASRSAGWWRHSGRRNVRIASRNASPKSAAFFAPTP